jgi:hypothetical protein
VNAGGTIIQFRARPFTLCGVTLNVAGTSAAQTAKTGVGDHRNYGVLVDALAVGEGMVKLAGASRPGT